MLRISSRMLFTCLLCCSLCLLGGCWSAVELSNRSFARIMLLDYSDEGVQLTLGFPLTNRLASSTTGGAGSGTSSEPFTYVTKSGKNIAEAFRLIQSDLTREITFGQLRNILIGRKFAEQGIKPFVDFIVRLQSVHIHTNLFITEGNVLKFMNIPITFERFPTDILTNFSKLHASIMITFKDMLINIYSGGDLILPLLVFGNKGLPEEDKGKNWVGTDGAAILKKGAMVGTLDTNETRGSIWVIDQFTDGVVSVASPVDGKQIAFHIQRAQTKIKPVVNGEQISFKLRSKATASLLLTESSSDVTNMKYLQQLEETLASKVEDQMDQAIARTKAEKTDALHFGQYIRWRYPRRWKSLEPNWRETFANKVSVDSHVDVTIKWLGVVKNPEWNRILPDTNATSS